MVSCRYTFFINIFFVPSDILNLARAVYRIYKKIKKIKKLLKREISNINVPIVPNHLLNLIPDSNNPSL